jgi:hypothetical protein
VAGDATAAGAQLRAAYEAMFREFWGFCWRKAALTAPHAPAAMSGDAAPAGAAGVGNGGGGGGGGGGGVGRFLSLKYYLDDTAAHRERVYFQDSTCVVVWDKYPKVSLFASIFCICICLCGDGGGL